jgi:hypothetical protein
VIEKDSTNLRIIVMWEHITPSDRKVTLPSTSVLFRIHDPRAVQFWDDERVISRAMDVDLPYDTLRSVAEIDSARGTHTAVAWDCIALFGAGRRWEDRFPVPDWAGRPVEDVAETLGVRLRALERSPAGHAPR